jgi:hypothetical protein
MNLVSYQVFVELQTLDKARVVDNQRLDAVCGTFEQQQSAFRQETIVRL